MTFSIRQWGVGKLIGAWAGYWVALGAVALAPFGRWVWELNRIPGYHGTASASLGDDGVTISALRDNVTVFTASASLPEIAFWVAGPPLMLWLLWLMLRPPRDEVDVVGAPASHDALPDPARGGWGHPITPTSTPSPVERRDRRGS